MNMDIQQIKDILFKKDIKIKQVAYYSYPTGTVGTSYVAEETTSDVNYELVDSPNSSQVVNLVDRQINTACQQLKIRRDNKEAVKCLVEGVDEPVYFCSYDNRRVICMQIDTKRGGTEYIL